MIKKSDLVANFGDVVSLGEDIYRCEFGTPRSTTYFYLRLQERNKGSDLLMVSENLSDDEFALSVLSRLDPSTGSAELTLQSLPSNPFGFDTLLVAPTSYHAYFKGILDVERQNLSLCLPVHHCEFSGKETSAEFVTLVREVVASTNWKRKPAPKIVLRFDNPKTRGGTSKKGVFAKSDLLVREIENLEGVATGFISIDNYQNNTLEIRSPKLGEFTVNAKAASVLQQSMTKADLLILVDKFLTN